MKYMHKKGEKIDGPKLGLGGKYYLITKGVFEIPDDVDPELHARVISAGHKPIQEEGKKKTPQMPKKKESKKKEAPKETPKEEKPAEKPAEETKEEEKPAEDSKDEAEGEEGGEAKEEAESEEKLTLADALMTVDGIGAGYSKKMIEEYKDADGIKAADSKDIAKKIDGVTVELADQAKAAIEKWEKGEL